MRITGGVKNGLRKKGVFQRKPGIIGFFRIYLHLVYEVSAATGFIAARHKTVR